MHATALQTKWLHPRLRLRLRLRFVPETIDTETETTSDRIDVETAEPATAVRNRLPAPFLQAFLSRKRPRILFLRLFGVFLRLDRFGT